MARRSSFRLLTQKETDKLAELGRDIPAKSAGLLKIVEWCAVKPPGPGLVVLFDHVANGPALALLLGYHILLESLRALFDQGCEAR